MNVVEVGIKQIPSWGLQNIIDHINREEPVLKDGTYEKDGIF